MWMTVDEVGLDWHRLVKEVSGCNVGQVIFERRNFSQQPMWHSERSLLDMKITLIRSGGLAYIPALNKPISIDTALIDSKIANELEILIQKARFYNLPERINIPKKGAADHRMYTITVQDGSRTHTIQFTDPIIDPALNGIISRLEALARASPPR